MGVVFRLGNNSRNSFLKDSNVIKVKVPIMPGQLFFPSKVVVP